MAFLVSILLNCGMSRRAICDWSKKRKKPCRRVSIKELLVVVLEGEVSSDKPHGSA